MAVTVPGPTPPQRRFPRGRYLRQLLEMQRELRDWRWSYAVQGIENRDAICGELVAVLQEATEILMQLKSK